MGASHATDIPGVLVTVRVPLLLMTRLPPRPLPKTSAAPIVPLSQVLDPWRIRLDPSVRMAPFPCMVRPWVSVRPPGGRTRFTPQAGATVMFPRVLYGQSMVWEVVAKVAVSAAVDGQFVPSP